MYRFHKSRLSFRRSETSLNKEDRLPKIEVESSPKLPIDPVIQICEQIQCFLSSQQEQEHLRTNSETAQTRLRDDWIKEFNDKIA